MIQRFEAVKQNMLSMLKYSYIEFQEYKSTNNIIYLQQAGEKLFNSLENYIQYSNKLSVRSFYELRQLVKTKLLKNLLYDTKRLHRFFYNAELEMDIIDAEQLYLDVYKKLKSRIERLK